MADEGKVFDCLVRPPTLKHVATIGGGDDDDYDENDDGGYGDNGNDDVDVGLAYHNHR